MTFVKKRAELIVLVSSDSEEEGKVTSFRSITNEKDEEPKPGSSRSTNNHVPKPNSKPKIKNGNKKVSSDSEEEVKVTSARSRTNEKDEEPKPGSSRSTENHVPNSKPKIKNGNKKKEEVEEEVEVEECELDPQLQKKYDKFLIKYMKKIKEIDEMEVDWDDEQNSAYLQKARLTDKLMKFYELLCQKTGDNGHLTGRAMQKKFTIEQVTRYPEIDLAVQNYLNRYCKPRVSPGQHREVSYSSPDYNDILDVVKSEIVKSNLVVLATDTESMAADLFRWAIRSYKKRRRYELQRIAIPGLAPDAAVQDPAETDAELMRKLEENKKLHRKEEDVMREFTERQRQMPEEEDAEDEEEEDEESSTEADDDDEPEKEEELIVELDPADSPPPPPPLKKKMKMSEDSD